MKKKYSLYFILLAGLLPVQFALAADVNGTSSNDQSIQSLDTSQTQNLDHGGPGGGHPPGGGGGGHPGNGGGHPGGPGNGGGHPGNGGGHPPGGGGGQPPHPVGPGPGQPPHPVGPGPGHPPHPVGPGPGEGHPPYPYPHPGEPRPGGYHPGDPSRPYEPYPVYGGHDPWPHWNHPPFPRPVYGWDWDRLHTVTCTAGDSNGDIFPVTESDYFGIQYESQLIEIEDTALDECYADTDGEGSCYLIGCTPGY
jgi:hypothetical protein